MSFETESFANRELLLEALKEMGFEQITEGQRPSAARLGQTR